MAEFDKLSLVEDDYIKELQDKGIAIWVAKLSNGFTIFMDDGRPGSSISSWLQLKKSLSEWFQLPDLNNVFISKLYLKFRDNIYDPFKEISNIKAFYFSKGISANLGDSGQSQTYNIGVLVDNKIILHKVYVPELILFTQEERPTKDSDFIIWNNHEKCGDKKLEDHRTECKLSS